MKSKRTNHNTGEDKLSMQYRKTGLESDPYIPGLISIIAPCFNESKNIELFLTEISDLDLRPFQCEVILVNDGSRDGSGMIMEVLKSDYPELQAIHFSRNFGQQQALMAGIRAARGEVLVTVDLDLQ